MFGVCHGVGVMVFFFGVSRWMIQKPKSLNAKTFATKEQL
jgi:hypothetical protein